MNYSVHMYYVNTLLKKDLKVVLAASQEYDVWVSLLTQFVPAVRGWG